MYEYDTNWRFAINDNVPVKKGSCFERKNIYKRYIRNLIVLFCVALYSTLSILCQNGQTNTPNWTFECKLLLLVNVTFVCVCVFDKCKRKQAARSMQNEVGYFLTIRNCIYSTLTVRVSNSNNKRACYSCHLYCVQQTKKIVNEIILMFTGIHYTRRF